MGDIEVFARRMKEAREQAGLKQKELAEKIGVSAQTISAYEKTGKLPTLDRAVLIADALGVSLDWLCGAAYKEATPKEKTKMDFIADLFTAVEKLGLRFARLSKPDMGYVIQLRNDELRGFNDLVYDLYKLRDVKEVLDSLGGDDYKTLVQKKIQSRAEQSNDFEKVERLEDDDLPF